LTDLITLLQVISKTRYYPFFINEPIKISTSENQAIFTGGLKVLESIDTIKITINTSNGNFEEKFSIRDTHELSEKLQVVILSTIRS